MSRASKRRAMSKGQSTGQILGLAHKLHDWALFNEINATDEDQKFKFHALEKILSQSSKWHVGDINDLPINCLDKPIPRLPDRLMLVESEYPFMSDDTTAFVLLADLHEYGQEKIQAFIFLYIHKRFVCLCTGFFDDSWGFSITDTSGHFSNIDKKALYPLIITISTTVWRLLSALRCINVQQVENPPPIELNSQRLKAGKSALYTYKTLHITSRVKTDRQAGVNELEARLSPRLHFRRGHARKLSDGRFTWVRQTIIGKKERGVIKNAYALANKIERASHA